MGLFGKLFRGGKKKVSKETVETRGVHMPDLNIPVDEKFIILFKQKGGKFLYCETPKEVSEALQNIIKENHWQDGPFYILNPLLKDKFSKEDISFTSEAAKSNVFLTTCEHLVAQNGSILVSSNQLQEKKLDEVPENVIVYATTSQLVETLGEGLKIINKKYQDRIPTNITSIKHFQSNQEDANDFLSYGSSPKHLYLLLLEDL